MRFHFVVFVALLCLLPGLPARAQLYEYTLIASSGTAFSSFSSFGPPSLNNNGTVGFFAAQRNGGSGIFSGSGGPLTTIAVSTSFSAIFSPVSISDAGTVAFKASAGSSNIRLFTGSGGPFTGVDSADGSTEFSVNNAGTVAYTLGGRAADNGRILTRRAGSSPTTLVDTRNSAFRYVNLRPSLNDAGVVAFAAGLDTGESGIFLGGGGPITTLYDTSGPFSGFDVFQAPSLNNNGAVAFRASLDAGGDGIFTGSGGSFTTIADTSGAFSSFGNLSLNDAGTVGFFANLSTGGFGLFTGPDPVADRIIGSGDVLLGSTVTGLSFSAEGLNNNGQVAFSATLADGRRVLVRADVVPEPGSLTLVIVAAVPGVGLALRRRVRR
jgi:hypothetical protein